MTTTKTLLTTAASLILCCGLSTFASNKVELPGYVDHITVNFNNSYPQAQLMSQSGGVSGSQASCTNDGQCTFNLADNGSSDTGSATYLIGSSNSDDPHCSVTLHDGWWVSYVTMDSSCNNANVSNLNKSSQYDYNFNYSIQANKKSNATK
jgi:hypothetical protein